MADWLEFVSTIPIFSFFTRAELEQIHDILVEFSYEKDETICRIGEEGDTFYVVLSGELEVWGGSHGDRLINTLEPRDFFGEMAILQGGKRTATIKASRRARLLALQKADFEKLFLKNPKAIEYFARVLCKRLASVTKGEDARKATMVISVGGRPGLKGKTMVASALAGVLKDLTGVDILLLRARPGYQGQQPLISDLLSDELEMVPEKIKGQLAVDQSGATLLDIGVSLDKPKSVYGERASNLVSK